jgi:FMN phosphatase YigB (HAD superfamily)
MRTFQLPTPIRGLILDIDNTLYANREYSRHQVDVLFSRLAEYLGEDEDSVRPRVSSEQLRIGAEQGLPSGAKTSLGNAFQSFGVSIDENARWRAELIHPEHFLAEDPMLREALERLAARYSLVCVTNNPQSIGRRTLDALGVAHIIPRVIGLDTSGRSKPDPTPFVLGAEALGLAVASCVSVGDRIDVDIRPMLDLGGGGILCEGLDDMYRLPETLE